MTEVGNLPGLKLQRSRYHTCILAIYMDFIKDILMGNKKNRSHSLIDKENGPHGKFPRKSGIYIKPGEDKEKRQGRIRGFVDLAKTPGKTRKKIPSKIPGEKTRFAFPNRLQAKPGKRHFYWVDQNFLPAIGSIV